MPEMEFLTYGSVRRDSRPLSDSHLRINVLGGIWVVYHFEKVRYERG